MSDTEENNEGRRRSRRQVPTSSKKNERMAALEKMQKARSEGRKYRVNVEELDQPLYDEVPEEEFQQREQERSEFVEGGYGSEEEWDDDAATSASTGGRKKPKEKKEKKKGGLYDHFAPAAQAKGKPQDDAPVNLDEDQDLMEMLGQIGNTPHLEVAPANPFGFAATTPSAAPRVRAANSGLKVAYPAPSPFDDEPSEVRPRKVLVQQKRPAAELPTDAPTPKQAKCTPQTPLEVDGGGRLRCGRLRRRADGRGAPTPPADFTTFANFEGNLGDEEVADEQSAEGEPSDKLRMYWIETFEDPYKNPGVVYLFGRMNGKSCCIVARNVEHKVYFVPREFDENGNADFEAEYKLVRNIFFNVGEVKGEVCRSTVELVKYVPTDDHMPREMKAIPANTKGDTFSHVLNTTATAMERLLLETKLRRSVLDRGLQILFLP
ncbi:DNA polymerase [Aphelenchoides fujianensis]|nr:DNA polymerase [Aphelenchoides fujianensis]